MALMNRFTAFLDRFDERLTVNSERVKHELNQWIDQRVALMRTEVLNMKTRICSTHTVTGQLGGNLSGFEDDPQVVTVSFQEFMKQQANLLRDAVEPNQASTSSGRKRKSTNQAGNKQKKSRSGASKQNTCKFPECGKSFLYDYSLAEHERLHLNIKPFSCTWANCGYSSETRPNVIKHIRIKHFRLPYTRKEQDRLNIVDDRNPEQFLQMDTELAQRRLV